MLHHDTERIRATLRSVTRKTDETLTRLEKNKLRRTVFFFVPFLRYRVNSICLNKYTYRGYKRTIDGKEFSILVDLVYVAVYYSFRNENFP